jgi:hypothetical protein
MPNSVLGDQQTPGLMHFKKITIFNPVITYSALRFRICKAIVSTLSVCSMLAVLEWYQLREAVPSDEGCQVAE